LLQSAVNLQSAAAAGRPFQNLDQLSRRILILKQVQQPGATTFKYQPAASRRRWAQGRWTDQPFWKHD